MISIFEYDDGNVLNQYTKKIGSMFVKKKEEGVNPFKPMKKQFDASNEPEIKKDKGTNPFGPMKRQLNASNDEQEDRKFFQFRKKTPRIF